MAEFGGPIDHPTSYWETMMHLLRGNIGPGMMAMGDAFKNAGILVGPPVLIFLGLVCVHCQHLLLNAAEEIKDRFQMDLNPNYADTVAMCFAIDEKLKPFSRTMHKLVNIFLCTTQLGFCCVYFLFVSKNFKQVSDYYDVVIDIHIYMAIIFIPILLTALVRNLKFLAPISIIANILILVGIVITLYYACLDLPSISSRPYVGEWQDMPLFFGTALFAFEGIGLVLPLQREMQEPHHFDKPLGVLNVGMTFVVGLFTTVGFLAYLHWGEHIEGSVTLNLPVDAILSQIVKIMIALGVMLTFALQFYIPIKIMWTPIEEKYSPLKHPVCGELGFRAVMVLATFTLAEIIPYLPYLISLVGAISSTALALLFPPILEFALKYTEHEVTVWMIIKNSIILVIGVVGCILGTYESIAEIVKAIRDDYF